MGLLQNKSEGETGRLILRQLLFMRIRRRKRTNEICGKYGGDHEGKD